MWLQFPFFLDLDNFSIMPRKCCVVSCTSKTYGSDIANVSYHTWPKDENLIEEWIQQLKNNQIATGFSYSVVVNIKSVICSLHFESRFLKITPKGKPYLAMGAVPTLFHCSAKEVF
jgi:hypothetical protein